MSVKQIDLLNIGLIFITAFLAYIFPLELFVFSFAILGPLHYLTEINWLDSKSYYTNSKKYTWLIIGVITSLIIVIPKLYFEYFESDNSIINHIFIFINRWSNSALFFSLMLAIGFLFIRQKYVWISFAVISIVGAIFLNNTEPFSLIIGMLIPTVIHVYIFTLLFMLYGSLKSKSKYGYLSVLIATLIPVVYIFIDVSPNNYLFGDVMKSNYIDNGLYKTPVLLAKIIGISDGTTFFFYEQMELRLMMFMSFIYSYHYLNWFSKTTTISWHKNLTIMRSLVIAFLWVIMILLFVMNFRVGFLVALFFSFLHVILEFPLNIFCIKNLLKRK